jgi:hypothetical protein
MAKGDPSGGQRVHVVLVPGFAGFDALGQLEYYAGVTPLFQSWKDGHKDRGRVVLHYFDNFPTAAVITRAERLRRYLAKRIARGEIQNRDAVVLVGHSTGGLDIRSLLYSHHPDIQIDGGAAQVKREEILDFVQGVVFLSVPQWGTNIADWCANIRSRGGWWPPSCAPWWQVRNCRSSTRWKPVSPAAPPPYGRRPVPRRAGCSHRGGCVEVRGRSRLYRERPRSCLRARTVVTPHGLGF